MIDLRSQVWVAHVLVRILADGEVVDVALLEVGRAHTPSGGQLNGQIRPQVIVERHRRAEVQVILRTDLPVFLQKLHRRLINVRRDEIEAPTGYQSQPLADELAPLGEQARVGHARILPDAVFEAFGRIHDHAGAAVFEDLPLARAVLLQQIEVRSSVPETPRPGICLHFDPAPHRLRGNVRRCMHHLVVRPLVVSHHVIHPRAVDLGRDGGNPGMGIPDFVVQRPYLGIVLFRVHRQARVEDVSGKGLAPGELEALVMPDTHPSLQRVVAHLESGWYFQVVSVFVIAKILYPSTQVKIVERTACRQS